MGHQESALHQFQMVSESGKHEMDPSTGQSSSSDSEAEEGTEREDDRANAPACIECDEGGNVSVL